MEKIECASFYLPQNSDIMQKRNKFYYSFADETNIPEMTRKSNVSYT